MAKKIKKSENNSPKVNPAPTTLRLASRRSGSGHLSTSLREQGVDQRSDERDIGCGVKVQNGIFSKIKLTESYTSLILGAIVVLIVGVLFITFAKGSKLTETSSVADSKSPQMQKSPESKTSSTYTIKPGDDLWSISEKVYDNGYKWIEIAKVNKLENPGTIHSGDKLIIPTLAQEEKSTVAEKTPSKVSNEVIENNSITENTYTIVKGDNLWDIAVRAYGDGFKWPEIAKANNLVNPNLIHSGNVLKIPR